MSNHGSGTKKRVICVCDDCRQIFKTAIQRIQLATRAKVNFQTSLNLLNGKFISMDAGTINLETAKLINHINAENAKIDKSIKTIKDMTHLIKGGDFW